MPILHKVTCDNYFILKRLLTNCNRACLTSFHGSKAKTTSTKLVIFLLAYFNSNILYSVHYVCLKSKAFCICFFSPSSSYPGLFQKIEEFRAKKKFHRPSNSWYNSNICCYKRKFFWSNLFLDQLQRRKIP